MDEKTEVIRTVAGLIAIITLMVLMVMSFQNPDQRIPDRTFQTLLILISALLGIDMVRERVPMIRSVTKAAMQAYLKEQEKDE